MKTFTRKLVIVFLPLVSFFIIPAFFLWESGEMSTFESYIHPLDNGQLFGLAYHGYDKQYKFYMTKDVYKPQVLALGSSRIMQLRKEIINPDYSFYNAGGAIQNIYEFRLFLETIGFKPELVVVNIDQFYFNPNYENQKLNFSNLVYDKPSWSFDRTLKNCILFYADWIKGKINLKEIPSSSQIGISAICKHCGFAADGTYWYGSIEDNPTIAEDYNFKNTMDRIQTKTRRFEACDHADKNLVSEIELLLQYCEVNQIRLVALIPPFAPTIVKALENDGNYGYLMEIYPTLKEIFDSYPDAYVYDFSSYDNTELSDADYIDGFHGSTIVYDAIVADVINNLPLDVRKYFSVSDSIKADIKKRHPYSTKYHSLLDN